MTSPIAHKILAPAAAVAVALGGLALLGVPDGTASALTQAVHTSHAAPASAPLARMEGVAHQSGAVTPVQRQAVLDYWTSERMAAALPITGLVGDALEAAAPEAPTERQAAPHDNSTGEVWTGGGAVTRTTGKVYLTMNGRDFTCSASVVDSANRSTVVTAGHCTKDGRGSWARNWTFVPGYDRGSAPYGRYTAREMLAPPRWARNADDSHDFAMVVLNTDGGTPVQNRVGAQRIAFDRWPQGRTARGPQVYAFGYPATSPYRGRYLHYCSGRTTPDDGGTTAHGMRCVMTQGSSGGPWFTGFDPATGRGTIASVVSFKYADDTRTQYGPRFGDEARRLFDSAQRL
ncbi:serine protease [Nocardiopsis sp. CNT312]|uniref:trypsin-like serine peptidase n=1 Tax=Nocardiopsis sp. CNT312 TaxID=1137268 RepID=UPI00048CE12E|nr:trypsin-like serine protease [Nocardiopsis sp. CNT312]